MRVITTAFVLIFVFNTAANGQWVTIADSNFASFLNSYYPQCMQGNDLDTTCPDVLNEVALFCNNLSISDLSGVAYFSNLKSLSVNQNQINVLPALPPHLRTLSCNGNNLINITSLPDSLVELFCENNQINSLPILPPKLTALACQGNNLSSLPGLPLTLKHLACGNNQLISLPALPDSLISLTCYSNLLTALPDLPDSLDFLFINDNPGITCLPSISKIGQFEFTNTSISCLSNYSQITYCNPPFSSIPLCDINNANGCPVLWNISGKTYFDNNGDCIIDTLDIPINNIKIKLFQNGVLEQQVISGNGGIYSFDTDFGTYSALIDSMEIPFTVGCPPLGVHTSVISQNDSLHYDKNFAMQCRTGIDAGIRSIRTIQSEFFPGDTTIINICAGDMSRFFGLNCASGHSGTLVVHFPPLISFISEFPGSLVPILSGDSLIYFINDFNDLNMQTDFVLLFRTDTSVQVCNIIPITATVISTTSDFNISNNSLTYIFRPGNSLDPNSKEVSPPDTILNTQEWLTYTINFQNIGSATAQHIRIIDTLSNYLDASTFELLNYSHTSQISLTGNVIRFNLPNINLPDSSANTLESMGYVQFKIKLLSGLSPGTLITNKADIYFDFNTAITTNTTQNLICNFVSLPEADKFIKYRIYPNPSNGNFTLSFPVQNHAGEMEIFDVNGKLVHQESVAAWSQFKQMDLTGLNKGIYFCKMIWEGKESAVKIIIE